MMLRVASPSSRKRGDAGMECNVAGMESNDRAGMEGTRTLRSSESGSSDCVCCCCCLAILVMQSKMVLYRFDSWR